MARRRLDRFRVVATLAGALAASACTSPTSLAPRPLEPETPAPSVAELPIVGAFEVEFDGEELNIRPLEGWPVESPEGAASAALLELPSEACGGNVPCTGTNKVVIESTYSGGVINRRSRTNDVDGSTGPWGPTAECGGTTPVPSTAVCAQIRVRNLYPDRQLERVYLEFVTLEPIAPSTAVQIPASASNNWASALGDYDLTTTLGAYRVGELGRSTPTTGGVVLRWLFTGSTPPATTFRYRGVFVVRGIEVAQTRRATLAGSDTPSSNYPDLGANEGTSDVAQAPSAVSISDDGRYVVFSTQSTVLGAPGGASRNIVRHDMLLGTNTQVTVAAAGTCNAVYPSISADGNWIAFQSTGCTLTPTYGTPPAANQVYVRDIENSTTYLVSRNATNTGYGAAASTFPRISASGNAVVFQTLAQNLDAAYPALSGTRNASCIEVYRYDVGAETNAHVSGVTGVGYSPTCLTAAAGQKPDIDDEGNRIAFVSRLALDPADDTETTAQNDIYVYDHQQSQDFGTQILWRVSKTSTAGNLAGGGAPGTDNPTISGNGAFVAFVATGHTNVTGVGSSTASRRHIYRRSSDQGQDATIERVTTTPGDTEGGQTSFLFWPALSTSGRFVAFMSDATTLAAVSGFFPTGATPISGTQAYVCDQGQPGITPAALARCFLASRAELTPGAAFANMPNTNTTNTFRVDLAYPDDSNAGYLAYSGIVTTGWAGMTATGVQTFVSPASIDPRSQMAQPSP